MHQQVIFLLDVRDASRRALDKKYLHPRPSGDQWSTIIFPKEDPSDEDFLLWKEALLQIRALGGRLHLGAYQQIGHKIWHWIYNINTLTLFHCHKQGVDLWESALGEGTSIRRANRYVCTEENTAVEPRGCPSTTAGTGAGIQKIISTTVLPPPPQGAHNVPEGPRRVGKHVDVGGAQDIRGWRMDDRGNQR